MHHMQAHVLANLIWRTQNLLFLFYVLQLVAVIHRSSCANHPAKMKVIGETIDDAAGEAFDKSAKMLGSSLPWRTID